MRKVESRELRVEREEERGRAGFSPPIAIEREGEAG
jgi:hypothetical protein